MTFADKVKYVRAKLLKSQQALAKEVGVSFSSINRWESQGQEPSFLAQQKFDMYCEAHGIKFDNETRK